MKKLVSILIVLFVIGLAGTLVSVNIYGGFSMDTYNVSDKVVVNNPEINQINIDLSSSDLSVHPTTDKEISVELNGKASKKLKQKLKLDVKERNQKLEVSLKEEKQINFNFGVMIFDANVDIYLPEKVYESIMVVTSSGDITIEELKAKEILLEASSGDIVAENSTSDSLFKLATSSGEINSHSNSADKFDLKASSGDLIVEEQQSQKAIFVTSSGEIELTNVIGSITADATSGDITIENKEVTGDIDVGSSSGEITVQFEKEPKSLAIDFNGGSGEGKVNIDGFNYEEKSENEIRGKLGSGEFKLRAHTSSGDFYLR